MSLTKELQEQCEEFLSQFPSLENGSELARRADGIRGCVKHNLSGWTKAGKEALAYGMLMRFELFWELAMATEGDWQLREPQFRAITGELRKICHDRLLLDRKPHADEEFNLDDDGEFALDDYDEEDPEDCDCEDDFEDDDIEDDFEDDDDDPEEAARQAEEDYRQDRAVKEYYRRYFYDHE